MFSDVVSKIIFREDDTLCPGHLPHCSPSVSTLSVLFLPVAVIKSLWQVSLCPSISETKAGHDILVLAVTTLAESGSLRVMFDLVHLNLSWIPSLSTLPLICITLCGHIVLAHYAKNNVDSIYSPHNMQSWHITFENQGNQYVCPSFMALDNKVCTYYV